MDTFPEAPDENPMMAEPLVDDMAGLDDLLHLRSHILETKPKVLAAELLERFDIRDRNVGKVEAEKVLVVETMPQFARQARYHLREPRDNATLYQQAFQLDKEHRSQQVGCWQDVSRGMRNVLDVSEAHQRVLEKTRPFWTGDLNVLPGS